MIDRPNNRDVVVYAIATLGGESDFVHTEDVAVKCHELAPDAFSWTRHAEYPDLEVARRTLHRVRSSEFGELVEGRSGQGSKNQGGRAEDGWRLTEAGRRWIIANGDRIEEALSATALRDRRQRIRQQLRRVFAHPTWAAYRDDPDLFMPGIGELAELMRVRVDAPAEVWSARFDELLSRATMIEESELLAFAKACRGVYEQQKDRGER